MRNVLFIGVYNEIRPREFIPEPWFLGIIGAVFSVAANIGRQ